MRRCYQDAAPIGAGLGDFTLPPLRNPDFSPPSFLRRQTFASVRRPNGPVNNGGIRFGCAVRNVALFQPALRPVTRFEKDDCCAMVPPYGNNYRRNGYRRGRRPLLASDKERESPMLTCPQRRLDPCERGLENKSDWKVIGAACWTTIRFGEVLKSGSSETGAGRSSGLRSVLSAIDGSPLDVGSVLKRFPLIAA